MGLKAKVRSFFFLDDEYSYEEEVIQQEEERQLEPRPDKQGKRQNIVSLQSVQKTSKVVIIEPKSYAEVEGIAEHLINRRATVVNLQNIDLAQAKRIVDFLSGTVYAIGGDIQKVGTDIFFCSPDNVEVTGQLSIQNDDEM